MISISKRTNAQAHPTTTPLPPGVACPVLDTGSGTTGEGCVMGWMVLVGVAAHPWVPDLRRGRRFGGMSGVGKVRQGGGVAARPVCPTVGTGLPGHDGLVFGALKQLRGLPGVAPFCSVSAVFPTPGRNREALLGSMFPRSSPHSPTTNGSDGNLLAHASAVEPGPKTVAALQPRPACGALMGV